MPAPDAPLIELVAARLARSDDPLDSFHDVVDLLRSRFGARSCVLWRATPGGFLRVAAAGDGAPDGAAVEAALSGDPPRLGDRHAILALRSGGRCVGALTFSGADGTSPALGRELGSVTNLLAPMLVATGQMQRLGDELALRTRQSDAQRRLIEKIVDSLPVGLYVIDREYRIQAWNRKRETGLLGVSRADAIGRDIFEILHRQPSELLRREFEDVFATGAIRQYQMESTAWGEPRTYRVTKIPMSLGSDDSVTHVITIGEDMTGWKIAQERVAQAEKLAAVGQLAAGVMHEINNPLATIGACAESMTMHLEEPSADSALGASFDEYLKIIDHEVHRCKRIIDGLLHFSRPSASVRTECDINLVLGETLFLLKHHARFKQMRVETDFDSAIGPIVRGNPEQLIQVFMALLLNATDAMNGDGVVRLRTRRGAGPADAVVIDVSDEGQGIPRTEMSKIFEPFYTTKPPGRGTGLGLSICYGIIADHDGRIEVDSILGQGSTFRVTFPCREPA